jgi:DNA-binding transcriptional regulator GbsR (MarR family)
MDKAQYELELKHFVEDVGLVMEQLGQPRMAGRLVGWLLVCDPPHQSMTELVEALQASKASISNTTRLLIHVGLIERISLPGYRHDHYRLKSGAWVQLTKARLSQIYTIRQLADRGLALLAGERPELKQRLSEMQSVYAFWEEEMPLLLERLEQTQKKLA